MSKVLSKTNEKLFIYAEPDSLQGRTSNIESHFLLEQKDIKLFRVKQSEYLRYYCIKIIFYKMTKCPSLGESAPNFERGCKRGMT